jgi:hypothetical protein
MGDPLESLKHDYDTYKHLTTLSTGAIVILSTFLEKVIEHPEWKRAVVVSIVCFFISVGFSVASMFRLSASIRSGMDPNDDPTTWDNVITGCALGGFAVGLVALVLFATRNLW